MNKLNFSLKSKLVYFVKSKIIKQDTYTRRKLIRLIIGGNRDIVSIYRGLKFNTSLNSSIESNLIFDNYNEEKLLDVIEKLTNDADLFIDVGANVGVHSLIAAKNRKTKVIAIEPEIDNMLRIKQNKALNELLNIELLQLACGDYNGFTYLHINDGWNKGKHSLVNKFGVNKQLTPVYKLDNLKDTYEKFKSIIIKIDVEGFELQVLMGSSQLLSKPECNCLIIELIQEFHSEETIRSIQDILSNSGFKYVYRMEHNKIVKTDKYVGSGDYIYTKNELLNEILN